MLIDGGHRIVCPFQDGVSLLLRHLPENDLYHIPGDGLAVFVFDVGKERLHQPENALVRLPLNLGDVLFGAGKRSLDAFFGLFGVGLGVLEHTVDIGVDGLGGPGHSIDDVFFGDGLGFSMCSLPSAYFW